MEMIWLTNFYDDLTLEEKCLLAKTSILPEELELLSLDEKDVVRSIVAENPATNISTLKKLSSDKAKRVKMEVARKLLEAGNHNVNEVGLKVGYSTSSHFISAFKKKYGTTPKKYLMGLG